LVNENKTIITASLIFIGTLLIVPFLGTSFIPEMKEGSIVPNILRVPNISLAESIEMEKTAMSIIAKIPGVKSAVSGLGRGESPADPQGQNESSPIVSLKPRAEWPEGWTQDTIGREIQDRLKVLPGAQVVMAQVTNRGSFRCRRQNIWRRYGRTQSKSRRNC